MRILCCDDHELFREGLRQVVLDLRADGAAPEVIGVADAQTAFAALAAHDFDLVLLDLALPGIDGFASLARIRAEHPDVPVVIVSASERPEHVRRAIDGGAAGFVPKSASRQVLTQALRLVLAGQVYLPAQILGTRSRADLSPRQLEVLQLLAKGLTNQDIARVLSISFGTAKNHVAAVIEALDAANRTEAVTIARDLGLVSD